MSIYKGGYILADISDTPLTDEPQDLLPQDLKDYILRYIKDNVLFKKDILFKPIKLIITDIMNYKKLITLDMISDDYALLYTGYIDANISINVNVNVDTLYISCIRTNLQTEQ